MVRSGRSHSKEDVRSINTDSGISLSSPPEIKRCLDDYDDDELEEKICINGDEEPSCKTSPLSRKKFKQFYTCNVCKKEFRGKTDLNRHMLIHSGERPHKCEQCGKSFRQAVNLKNHITIVHVGKKQFACTECSKSFALKERLRLHMRIHSGEKPYVCNECNKKFARGGQLTQHLLTNHDSSSKKFVCSKCSAGFLTAGNLKAHLKRHEEGFDTFCDKCAVHFPNNMLLQAHINKTHNQLEEQYCEICEKYIKFEQFAAHLKSHSSSKFHVCEVCNSCFTQKSQYNVHLRMHTGERPYQCRICLQTFAHSSVLKLHIRKHTGEKPFSCILCKDGVAFSQLAHLKTHMKKVHNQHNSYMCEGCNEFFKTKAHLLEHTEKSSSCKPVGIERQNSENTEAQQLSNLRLLIAILLKKISPEEKLKQLGYEKRLIDNVVIASLKVANRKTYDDTKLSAIERMRLNIEEFLNWIVPDQVMNQFRSEKLLVDTILDKIVTIYLKQK